jgi:sporulation protein YlmC with PRC-barrel domain
MGIPFPSQSPFLWPKKKKIRLRFKDVTEIKVPLIISRDVEMSSLGWKY